MLSGYIPRRPFKFGATYKNECDISIDEHLTGLQRENTKLAELQMATARFPSFEAQRHDPVVRDHLNTYRDTHPHRPILMGTHSINQRVTLTLLYCKTQRKETA